MRLNLLPLSFLRFINKPNNIPNAADSIVDGLTVIFVEKSYTDFFESKSHIISTVLIVTEKNVLIKLIILYTAALIFP